MAEIAGVLIFNSKQQNGATAKLWEAAAFTDIELFPDGPLSVLAFLSYLPYPSALTAVILAAYSYEINPEQDADEPDGGYLVDTVTTGLQYGGDGAFRFVDVPSGRYYVSVEYDGHRAWWYAGDIDIYNILDTEGDMLYRDSSGLVVLNPAGGTTLTLRDGLPRWC